MCTTSFCAQRRWQSAKETKRGDIDPPAIRTARSMRRENIFKASAADAGGIKAEGDGPLPLPRAGRRIGAAPLTLLKMSCFAFSSALPLPAGSNITLGTKALANSDPFAVRSAAHCCTPPLPSLGHPQKKSQMQ